MKGKKLCIGFNRMFLIEGLKMGFRRFELVDKNQPIIARDERKLFLFMPIGEAEDEDANHESRKKRTVRDTKESKNQEGRENGMDIEGVANQLNGVKDLARQLFGSIVEVEKSLKARASDMKKCERLMKNTLSSPKDLKELTL